MASNDIPASASAPKHRRQSYGFASSSVGTTKALRPSQRAISTCTTSTSRPTSSEINGATKGQGEVQGQGSKQTDVMASRLTHSDTESKKPSGSSTYSYLPKKHRKKISKNAKKLVENFNFGFRLNRENSASAASRTGENSIHLTGKSLRYLALGIIH